MPTPKTITRRVNQKNACLMRTGQRQAAVEGCLMIVFLLSDSDETDDDAFLFPHFDFGSPIFFKITPT